MTDIVYINRISYTRETLHIKNMMCDCCLRVVKEDLGALGLIIESVVLGKAVVLIDTERTSLRQVSEALAKLGMGLIAGREEMVVEQTKQAVVDLIHRMNNVNSIVQKSEYLVGKLGMSYQQLSRLFSKHEGMTLEKYIILHKIERIKELIDQDEFTLSEIAWMMDYSSVQYLSSQFRKYTGYTVSDYKAGAGGRISLHKLS
ncbi:protein containing helix-turn-helix domain [Bacteroidales bacterium 6E]|nr:protein containing helix-turn-helix domain [Bacteroidales bacterium 6E]